MFNDIFVLNEAFINGFSVEFLDTLSFAAIISGILVIIAKNPIVSVLFLIGLFLSIASFLNLVGLSFIGLSYVLVYVGAVSILFLFILMLINVRVSELLSSTRSSIPLAIIISLLFTYSVSSTLPYNTVYNYIVEINNTLNSFLFRFFNVSFADLFKLSAIVLDKRNLYYVTSDSWDGSLSEASHITSIGNIMYTSYSIWLILTSIILLLAMVGAIVITIKQKI